MGHIPSTVGVPTFPTQVGGVKKIKKMVVNAAGPKEAGRILILSFIGIWLGRYTGF